MKKEKHFFEKARVYGTNLYPFSHGAAVTIPLIGIVTGNKFIHDNDLLRHEFGHILQYRKHGFVYYWLIISPASLSSAIIASFKKKHEHMRTWTELSANQLNYQYFNRPNDWDFKRYPISF